MIASALFLPPKIAKWNTPVLVLPDFRRKDRDPDAIAPGKIALIVILCREKFQEIAMDEVKFALHVMQP
jgi:hypothetical protein